MNATPTPSDSAITAERLAAELDRLGGMDLQAHDIAQWVEANYQDLLSSLRDRSALTAERDRLIEELEKRTRERDSNAAGWKEAFQIAVNSQEQRDAAEARAAELVAALKGGHRKLATYVGVFTGDKELTALLALWDALLSPPPRPEDKAT